MPIRLFPAFAGNCNVEIGTRPVRVIQPRVTVSLFIGWSTLITNPASSPKQWGWIRNPVVYYLRTFYKGFFFLGGGRRCSGRERPRPTVAPYRSRSTVNFQRPGDRYRAITTNHSAGRVKIGRGRRIRCRTARGEVGDYWAPDGFRGREDWLSREDAAARTENARYVIPPLPPPAFFGSRRHLIQLPFLLKATRNITVRWPRFEDMGRSREDGSYLNRRFLTIFTFLHLSACALFLMATRVSDKPNLFKTFWPLNRGSKTNNWPNENDHKF